MQKFKKFPNLRVMMKENQKWGRESRGSRKKKKDQMKTMNSL